MLAFAAGALIVAVAFELFEPAHRQAGLARASAALLVGAATFIAVDLLLQRRAGAEAAGLALVAAATLDGIPENLALGVGLAESGSYALLASIVVSNLPEAFGGAARMRQGGLSSARIVSVWSMTALLVATALVVGRLAADVASEQSLGMLAAFAAGAVLATLADSVMPEAYAEGGPLVALPRAVASSSPTRSQRSIDERRICRPRTGRQRGAAAGEAQRGSGMAAAPGMLGTTRPGRRNDEQHTH
jgi:zinc transporter, ZIP family